MGKDWYRGECKNCGTPIRNSKYCHNCYSKLQMWITIQAMVLGCKRSEVDIERAKYNKRRRDRNGRGH